MLLLTFFQDWQKNPVLTTVKTSAFPIKDIPFPTVTICGQGMNADIITAGFFNVFFKYLKDNGHDMGLSPTKAVNIANQVTVRTLGSIKGLQQYRHEPNPENILFFQYMSPVSPIFHIVSTVNS